MNVKSMESKLDDATKRILAPGGLTAESVIDMFSRLASRKIDHADLYFQYSRSESWAIEDGIVKVGSFNIDQGVGAR